MVADLVLALAVAWAATASLIFATMRWSERRDLRRLREAVAKDPSLPDGYAGTLAKYLWPDRPLRLAALSGALALLPLAAGTVMALAGL